VGESSTERREPKRPVLLLGGGGEGGRGSGSREDFVIPSVPEERHAESEVLQEKM
jgi:hypothetical protein